MRRRRRKISETPSPRANLHKADLILPVLNTSFRHITTLDNNRPQSPCLTPSSLLPTPPSSSRMTVSTSLYGVPRNRSQVQDANMRRPTSSSPSSRPPRSKMSSPSGHHCSPRCAHPHNNRRNSSDVVQALEGKDVKDLLLNVGSGGGAAPAAGGAAAATGGDAPAEEKAAEKEEGTLHHPWNYARQTLTTHREGGVRRGHGFRSLRLSAFPSRFLRHLPSSGFSKRVSGRIHAYSQPWGREAWALCYTGISPGRIYDGVMRYVKVVGFQ